MASFHLYSGDLVEVGRPVPKVIKAKAKKLNLPPSLHHEYYLHLFLFLNDLSYHVNLFLSDCEIFSLTVQGSTT
jgi:hypothetical protein